MPSHAFIFAVTLIATSGVHAVCDEGQIGILQKSGGLISAIVANDCGQLDEKPVGDGFESNVCDMYSGQSDVDCQGNPFDNDVIGLELFDGSFWGDCSGQGSVEACGGNLLFCCSPLA